MSSQSYSKKILSVVLLQLVLLLQTSVLTLACWVEYDWDCEGGSRSITQSITHYTDDNSAYEANVVFHWGIADTNLGYKTYSEETNEEIESYQYDGDGEYYSGYTVTFGEGSGCDGRVSERYYLISFEDRGCTEIEDDGTPPTNPPTTISTSQSTEGSTPTPEPTVATTAVLSTTKDENTCRITWEGHVACDQEDLSAKTNVTFKVDGEANDEQDYIATVAFHWGEELDTATGYIMYTAGEQIEKIQTHQFEQGGAHYVGYTVTLIEDGSELTCEETSFQDYFMVEFFEGSCAVKVHNGTVPTRPPTNPPTKTSTNKSTTLPPTDTPSSSSPSKSPTILPVTSTPPPLTTSTTEQPTTPAPVTTTDTTSTPGTITATTASTTSASETPAGTTTPTTKQPTTPAPVIATATTSTPGTTTSAIDSAVSTTPETTPAATLAPAQEYKVLSTMILYNSEEMSTESKSVWRDATEKTILDEVVSTTGVKPELVHVYVSIRESLNRVLRENHDGNVQMLRNRQAAVGPLKVVFITTLEFPSQKEDWDAEEMVAAGFDSQEKQQKYINSLKANSHFDNVQYISLNVNGDLVTETSPAIDAINRDEQEDGNDSRYGIVAAAVAAVVGAAGILFLGFIVGKYYKARNDRDGTNAISVVTFDKNEVSAEEGISNESNGAYAGITNGSHGPLSVIEAKTDDDISALEDPTIFNVPYVIEGDKTVGESTVSPLYGIDITQPGSTVGTSWFGDSTIDCDGNAFGDDPFEVSYRHSPGATASDDGSSLQRYTVVAPSGKLGIYVDNPKGDFPIVCAIKETSALNGKIEVGDLMLLVDEVDCFGLSPKIVSAILNVRSQNPARTLVMAKGTGIYWAGHEWSCDGRSVTYIITHYIDNGEELEYNATVVFHWGPTDTNLGSQTYSSDEINKETSTYQYDEEGEYNVGHTIIFEEGSGCEGRISESYTLLSLEDRWCAVVEFESSAPTLEPTEVSLFLLQLESSAPTPEHTDPPPTVAPTSSSSPSSTPTISTTSTQPPSTTPTTKPSTSPPTTAPTSQAIMTIIPPSRSPSDGPSVILPATSEPSKSPTLRPGALPSKGPSVSPITLEPTALPTISTMIPTQVPSKIPILPLIIVPTSSTIPAPVTTSFPTTTATKENIISSKTVPIDGGGDNSVWIIVTCLMFVGALLLALSITAGKHFTAKKDKDEEHVTSDITGDKIESDEELATKCTDVRNESHCPYLEEFEAKGGDDISVLEDPAFVDTPIPLIRGDTTVGESTVSSYLYGLDVLSQPDTSQFGGSTVDCDRLVLGDNVLEDSYQPSPGTTGMSNDNNNWYRVVAPSGKLGLFMDNPRRELPVVCAIKETSALKGKINIGDLMLQMDEINCVGISAKHLSAILNERSENSARILVMAKGSNTMDQL